MNKWILLISFCSLFNTATAQQYSLKVCTELEHEQKNLRNQLNTRLSEKQQQRLTQRQKDLFINITQFCDLTAPTNSTRSYQIATNNNTFVKHPVADMSVFTRRYDSNHKQTTWVNYYELPQPCRSLAMSDSEFVWCSENRVKQRAKFESDWQKQLSEAKPDDAVHEIVLPKQSSAPKTPSLSLLPEQYINFMQAAIFGIAGFLLLIIGYTWLLKNKAHRYTK